MKMKINRGKEREVRQGNEGKRIGEKKKVSRRKKFLIRKKKKCKSGIERNRNIIGIKAVSGTSNFNSKDET